MHLTHQLSHHCLQKFSISESTQLYCKGTVVSSNTYFRIAYTRYLTQYAKVSKSLTYDNFRVPEKLFSGVLTLKKQLVYI